MLTFVDATKEDITSSEQQPAPYAFGLSSADEDIEEDVASTRTKTVDKIETTWDDIPRNIDESHYRESIPVASLSLSGGLEDIADVSASFEANCTEINARNDRVIWRFLSNVVLFFPQYGPQKVCVSCRRTLSSASSLYGTQSQRLATSK